MMNNYKKVYKTVAELKKDEILNKTSFFCVLPLLDKPISLWYSFSVRHLYLVV